MRKLFFILFIACSSYVNAQINNFSFNLPAQESSTKKGKIGHVVGYDNNAYYLLRSENPKIYIQKVDAGFKTVMEAEVAIAGKSLKEYLCTNVMYANDNLYAFFQHDDKPSGMRQLLVTLLDKGTLHPKGELTKVVEMDWGKNNPLWIYYT